MIFNHQTLIFPAGCRFFVSEGFQSEREAARQTEQKRRGTGADLPPRRQRRRSSLSLWIFLEDLCPHKVVTAVGHQSYLPIVYEVSVLLMDTKQMSDSTNQNRVDCSLMFQGSLCIWSLLLPHPPVDRLLWKRRRRSQRKAPHDHKTIQFIINEVTYFFLQH